MEAELTGALKINSKTDNSAVTEEANVDEAITEESKDNNRMKIELKHVQNTQSYEESMNIYIENINTFENRNKVYTTKRKRIYEVIETDLLRNLISFQMIFQKMLL